MPKQAKPQKASETPEGSQTVGGRIVAPNALVQVSGNPEHTGHVVTVQEAPLGITLPETMTQDDYALLGRRMGEALQGASWKVGDYANFGSVQFGIKDYGQIAEFTGLDQVYLRQCASVAERVSLEFRQLASLERFRIMLPHRTKVVVDGKASQLEPVAELVARFDGWTQAEIRAGEKNKPKELSAGSTGAAAGSPTPDAGGTDEGKSGTSAQTGTEDAAATAGGTGKAERVVTSTEIHRMLGDLHNAVQAMPQTRLAMFAVIEEKLPRLPQTIAILKILRDQVRTEINKPA